MGLQREKPTERRVAFTNGVGGNMTQAKSKQHARYYKEGKNGGGSQQKTLGHDSMNENKEKEKTSIERKP